MGKPKTIQTTDTSSLDDEGDEGEHMRGASSKRPEGEVPSASAPPNLVDTSTATITEDAPNLEESDDGSDSVRERMRKDKTKDHRSSRRYFFFAIGLWLFEFVLVISLKRIGILNPDFEPMEEMLDSVLPYIDEFGEGISNFLPSINESLDSLTHSMMSPSSDKKNVGYKLAQEGAESHYPIVMVPGFVTSGLEVWAGKECTKGFFRQRLWAALTGAKSFVLERSCWKKHMMLNPFTGEDPEGIRVRSSEGFGATDYFLVNYWVFAKLIESLAEVGYTPSNMAMEPYDWRLAFPMLEKRDGFLTRLKYRIEAMHKFTGKKIVLATHSMGAMVVHHFFGWVTASEKEGGGGGGKDWVDKHIHTYISIAGAHLGVPKAATALLSGEMSDVVFTGQMEKIIEQFFGRRLRRDLWSSWGSLWAMLPKGGDALWGPGYDMCLERSSGDTLCPDADSRMSPMIAMTDTAGEIIAKTANTTVESRADLDAMLESFVAKQEHRIDGLVAFLQDYGGGLGPDHVGTKFMSQLGEEKVKSRQWYDTTRHPLPYAPKLHIFCLYGTGLATERAYYYKRNWIDPNNGDKDNQNITEPVVVIDNKISNKDKNISYGIKYGDGDGSVPLISLGYMCADAWRRKDSGLNPSQAQVFTREYKHKSEFHVDDPMRGGPSSSDHVDILGNAEVLEDFIKIVTTWKREDVESDRIVSDIKEIAEKTNAHPKGGLFKKKKSWIPR